MKVQRSEYGTKLWLSANDTYNWAHTPGKRWPGSSVSNRRLFVEFDSGGDLVDMELDNGRGDQDVPNHELCAIVEDFLGSPRPEATRKNGRTRRNAALYQASEDEDASPASGMWLLNDSPRHWAFYLGNRRNVSSMSRVVFDGEPGGFQSRSEAVAAAKRKGMLVAKNGKVVTSQTVYPVAYG